MCSPTKDCSSSVDNNTTTLENNETTVKESTNAEVVDEIISPPAPVSSCVLLSQPDTMNGDGVLDYDSEATCTDSEGTLDADIDQTLSDFDSIFDDNDDYDDYDDIDPNEVSGGRTAEGKSED